MRNGTVGFNVRRLWGLYCSIILFHAIGSAMLITKLKDHRPDKVHYLRRTRALGLMMGMTQAMVRDGNAPTSVQLFYSRYFELCYDKLGFRKGRIMYLSLVLHCVLELVLVRVHQLHLPLPDLSFHSHPMAPKRQFRGEVGSGEASGLSSAKGKSFKRQT